MGVVKLADYRPQLEVVEHRVADTEDGFMRVANEIMGLCQPLTGVIPRTVSGIKTNSIELFRQMLRLWS